MSAKNPTTHESTDTNRLGRLADTLEALIREVY